MTSRTMTEYIKDSEGNKYAINMTATLVEWGVTYTISNELDAYKFAFNTAKFYNQDVNVEKMIDGNFLVTVFKK